MEQQATTGLYLTFRLGEELFALDVGQVREVLEMSAVTAVPGAPPFMRGIVNVRGAVVPVVDLRVKFGMTPTGQTVHTRIIVLECDLEGEPTVLGALADMVHEVVELDNSTIEPPPRISSGWRSRFVSGIGKHNGEFVLILDAATLFTVEELTAMGGPAEQGCASSSTATAVGGGDEEG